jgi:hypothetical protein
MTKTPKVGDVAKVVWLATGELCKTLTVERVTKSDVFLSEGMRCTHRGNFRGPFGGGVPLYRVVFE